MTTYKAPREEKGQTTYTIITIINAGFVSASLKIRYKLLISACSLQHLVFFGVTEFEAKQLQDFAEWNDATI